MLTVLPSRNAVILDSLNIAKRHTAARAGRAEPSVMQAGIIDKFMPIDASAVALWCSKHEGPARAGYRDDKGKKVRVLPQVRGGRYDDATPEGALRRPRSAPRSKTSSASAT